MDWLTDLGLETATVIDWGTKIVMAIVALIIGFWLVGKITGIVKRNLAKRNMDASLQGFLAGLVSILLKAAVFISVASMVGIETTSFVAILGAGGLAVGLALQGSLANFAGGVLILIFKPFKVGDLIDAQGHFGVVKEINVFVTTLTSPENKTIIIPNGPLANDSITNLTEIGNLRVDLVAGIGYGEDIKKAKDVIMKVMQDDPKVLQDPAPSVNVLELADSSVNLAIRPYATVADYWDVYFGITEKVKIALDEAGIEIPFPQTVMHQAG
ncbi:MAG: mechanosensitive ion channel domain-containing protein [Bacteroidota bacterium]